MPWAAKRGSGWGVVGWEKGVGMRSEKQAGQMQEGAGKEICFWILLSETSRLRESKFQERKVTWSNRQIWPWSTE